MIKWLLRWLLRLLFIIIVSSSVVMAEEKFDEFSLEGLNSSVLTIEEASRGSSIKNLLKKIELTYNISPSYAIINNTIDLSSYIDLSFKTRFFSDKLFLTVSAYGKYLYLENKLDYEEGSAMLSASIPSINKKLRSNKFFYNLGELKLSFNPSKNFLIRLGKQRIKIGQVDSFPIVELYTMPIDRIFEIPFTTNMLNLVKPELSASAYLFLNNSKDEISFNYIYKPSAGYFMSFLEKEFGNISSKDIFNVQYTHYFNKGSFGIAYINHPNHIVPIVKQKISSLPQSHTGVFSTSYNHTSEISFSSDIMLSTIDISHYLKLYYKRDNLSSGHITSLLGSLEAKYIGKRLEAALVILLVKPMLTTMSTKFDMSGFFFSKDDKETKEDLEAKNKGVERIMKQIWPLPLFGMRYYLQDEKISSISFAIGVQGYLMGVIGGYSTNLFDKLDIDISGGFYYNIAEALLTEELLTSNNIITKISQLNIPYSVDHFMKGLKIGISISYKL